MKILRPREVGAKTRLGDKLHAGFLTLARQRMAVAICGQEALLGGALQVLGRLQAELLGDARRSQLVAGMRLGFRGLVGVGRGRFGLAGDALRLFVGIFVKLGVFRALDQDAISLLFTWLNSYRFRLVMMHISSFM